MSLLLHQTERDITALRSAIAARDANAARDAALRVTQDELDVRSRHEPVDRARFALWARQLDLGAHAGNKPAAIGVHACLKWTLDRIRPDVPNEDATDRTLTAIADALDRDDLATAAALARALDGR